MKGWVDYEGYRFTAPFFCMCCRIITTPQQWAYGRTCARCDTGSCRRDGVGHLAPDWTYGNASREEAIRRFAEAVGAEALGTERILERSDIARKARPLEAGTPKAGGLLTEGKDEHG